jgi:lipid-A-disaccharide synthase
MRYYLVAGERSGDLHGSNLIKAIKLNDPLAEFKGFGGDKMVEAGMSLTVNYSELAFMGFVEVLTNLRKISNFIERCKKDILSFKPDVIILIDYAGFNRRIARFGKINSIKVYFYISPKVWAWRQRRALQLKANVDRMFVILPFEKSFYKKFDWDVDYVGNPVLDAIKVHKPDLDFKNRYSFDPSKPVIALLPGSRKQELERMIPLMAGVAQRFSNCQFAVAAVSNLDKSHYESLSRLSNVKFIYEDTYNLLLNAQAAIVTSGTATLETALFKVPQVVVYQANAVTYAIVKMVIKISFISLVNLIADKEVVKELIQDKANVNDVANELEQLVNNKAYRSQMLSEYNAIYNTLDTGSASENAARLMVKYLKS